MALVAPGILVHGREESSVSRAKHQAAARDVLGDANSGREIEVVRKQQALWIAVLATYEN